MDVRDFDFDLPSELIAQEPAPQRGGSRLLFLDRAMGAVIDETVAALPERLERGDVLVINNTRVFPARLLGRRVPSGGAVECLLVAPLTPLRSSDTTLTRLQHHSGTAATPDLWEALVHPGQKLKPGARVVFEGIHTLHGEILERRHFGRRVLRLWTAD